MQAPAEDRRKHRTLEPLFQMFVSRPVRVIETEHGSSDRTVYTLPPLPCGSSRYFCPFWDVVSHRGVTEDPVCESISLWFHFFLTGVVHLESSHLILALGLWIQHHTNTSFPSP